MRKGPGGRRPENEAIIYRHLPDPSFPLSRMRTKGRVWEPGYVKVRYLFRKRQLVVTKILFCKQILLFAMRYLILLCCALCSFLELGHSQIVPYVSFMGDILANNSYVDITLVGSSENDSVQCHTDLVTCCNSSLSAHRGDWYFPDGTRLPFAASGDDIYEVREAERVDLRCASSVNSPAGIYRCDIPTNDSTDTSVRESIFVGLYPTEEGKKVYTLNVL